MTTSQRGFTIVSAIFILVVLAALGAFIAVVSTTQQIGAAMDVQGARAYQAARAGIEWGTYRIWVNNQANRYTNKNCDGTTNSPITASFIPPAPTLSAFTVTVTCSVTPDAAGGPTVYSITAVACNQPSPAGSCPGLVGNANYVERRMTVAI